MTIASTTFKSRLAWTAVAVLGVALALAAVVITFNTPVHANSAPDLEVGTPSVDDATLYTGNQFTLSVTVTNSGDGASEATTLRYYLSTDSTISSSDTEQVHGEAVGALAAGGTSDHDGGLTAPSEAGTYYYGACVDSVTGESDTTDNCSSSVTVTVSDPAPDLVVIGIDASDNIVTGGSFRVGVTVTNQGDAQSAATTLRWKQLVDGTTTEIGTAAQRALTRPQGSFKTIRLTAPSTPGTSSYWACVDSVAGESDTTNNCSGRVTVTVSDPAPDLVVIGIDASDNIVTGGSFRVGVTVTNQGDAQSAATTLRWKQLVDGTTTEIGTAAQRALTRPQGSFKTIRLTAPSTPGTSSYWACVDSVAGESDTTNNCSGRVTVTVTNNLATGAPTISGTAQVGQTLTASTSGIADTDGLTNVSYNYQWLADDVEIDGATAATYTLVDEDEGKPITVQVSFTDDLGYRETVTSDATSAVVPRATVPGKSREVAVEPGGAGKLTVSWTEPASDGDSEITGYKVQWKEAADSWDTADDVSEATVTGITQTISGLTDGVRYAVRVVATNSIGDGLPSREVTTTPSNNSATGLPTISGTAKVGQSLTASTTGIADADGLTNATFTYQWLADDVEISGATAASYTLVAADEGEAITVEVSFTDDRGYQETVTSDATSAVVPRATVPGKSREVAVEPGGAGKLTVSWTEPASDGDSEITGYKVQWKEAADSWDTADDVSEATVTGTTQTISGLTDGVRYAVRVVATNSIGDGLPSREVKTTPGNNSATGQPTISGTAKVGETLTASTTGIADADGLTNATFTYQWLADDVEISGATAASYTLVAADEGEAITVEVSFTDDRGYQETVTSDATSAVAPLEGTTTTSVSPKTVTSDATSPVTSQESKAPSVTVSPIDNADGPSNGVSIYERLIDEMLVRDSEGPRRAFTLPRATSSPVLFDIKYSGAEDFKMLVVDSGQYGGIYERLLTPARLSGPYEGVRALVYKDGMFEHQEEAAGAFNVRVVGDGAWEVKIGLPDFGAPPVTVVQGSGDNVVGPWVLRSPNPAVADFHFAVTHQGSEFSARLIASDGTVRTLVPYQNTAFANRTATVNVFAPWNSDKGADDLQYDDYVLEIQADGEWTVRLINPTPEPAPRQESIPLKRVLGTHKGLGNEELLHSIAHGNVPNSPILFDIDFRGGSTFDVMLVNTISHYVRRLTSDATTGPYQGVRALPYRDGELDGQPVPWFDVVVEGLGPWEVKIGLPDFSAPAITSANGSGDNVIGPFVLKSDEPFADEFLFEVTHSGANFEARLIASDGTSRHLIPPQHIPFENRRAPLTLHGPGVLGGDSDELLYGEYVLAIQADGEWTVRLIEEGSRKDDPVDG